MARIYSSASKWTGEIGTGGVSNNSVTTIPLASASGLTESDYYVFSIDRVDANSAKTPTKWEECAGQLSGTNFIGCTRGTAGTAQGHSAGAVVEILFSSKHWEELKDYLEVEHDTDGTHDATKVAMLAGAQTITGAKTFNNGTLLAANVTNGSGVNTFPTTSDTLVNLTGTQALSNKTLTSPVINTGISGTGIAAGSDVTTGTSNTLIVTPKGIGDAGVNTRLQSKLITATRDMTTASGDVAYTGVGFVPTCIFSIFSINTTANFGFGFCDSSRTSATGYQDYNNTAAALNELVDCNSGSGAAQAAVVKSFDADGFTLTWTKTSSPSGTLLLKFICFK